MEKNKVFVIMPFTDDFFEVYEMLKMQFIDSYDFSNAGEEGNQQNILKDIVQPIYEADVIIADLTGLNPNVMYELGLAHALNKKTILITQDELSKLPFDLKQYRAKDYSTHFRKFAELVDYLRINLNGAIDDSIVYSNPVIDFLDSAGLKKVLWFDEKDNNMCDESDKGYLDYIADIEENTEKLTNNINEMSREMQEMNEGISKSSLEINRVKQMGGSGTASFVRKETKKAAKYVEQFSYKLRNHNKINAVLWDEIEKNSLGLIENPFSSKPENHEGLISYLKSLYEMKSSASNSGESICQLRSEMQNIIGIERSMNQAIRFANEDLTTYVLFLDRISNSIDKILNKARFIVGDINFEKE